MRKIIAVAASLLLATGMTMASDAEETVRFEVEQMTCATCPIAVRKAMLRVSGVKSVDVSMADKSAVVTFDPNVTTTTEIGQASTDVGFPATAKDVK
jgi:periplasmic mercuric ion binding protein